MTEADTTKRPYRPDAFGGYVAPILTGLLIVVAGLLPWTLLAQLNARVRPDLPWAAPTTVAYLAGREPAGRPSTSPLTAFDDELTAPAVCAEATQGVVWN